MKNKTEAKYIAIEAIRELSKCKYFYNHMLYEAVSRRTADVKVRKEAYNQARRALMKLKAYNIN